MEELKLSEQAMGAIMMALQKSLAEQSDIVPLLDDLNWKLGANGRLYVQNPPLFKIDVDSLIEEDVIKENT